MQAQGGLSRQAGSSAKRAIRRRLIGISIIGTSTQTRTDKGVSEVPKPISDIKGTSNKGTKSRTMNKAMNTMLSYNIPPPDCKAASRTISL